MPSARLPRIVLWLFCGLVIVFLVAPILVIVIASFNGTPFLQFPPASWSLRWYVRFFASERWYEAALLSLRVAVVVTIASTALGTLAAIGLVRGRTRFRAALELFLVSPMVVPVIVMAVGLYFLLAPLRLTGSAAALVLGHTIVATPIVIVIVAAALRLSDGSLELAARSLGATWWRTVRYVTVPQVAPAIGAAAAFAFLTSFDEVVLAVFLGGPDATTLPKRMWESMRFEIDPTLTAISTLLTVVATVILAAAQLARRAEERS
ncbi:MAG: ABC transporter permease [Proteobacteria bacterium]|nr:ABC transporter permease [Pseudomonadota bacterium]